MGTITIKSDKPVVLIPIDVIRSAIKRSEDEYESMKETIELLSNQPDLPKKLREERRKIEKGECITFRDFKKKHTVKDKIYSDL